MTVELGPRTVTIAYSGGPYDGWRRPYIRSQRPMPARLDGYRLHGLVGLDDTRTWGYRWEPLAAHQTPWTADRASP